MTLRRIRAWFRWYRLQPRTVVDVHCGCRWTCCCRRLETPQERAGRLGYRNTKPAA